MGKCLTTEKFKQIIDELYPGKYELLGEYKQQTKPIHVRYVECGHESFTKAEYIRQGHGCPQCHAGTPRNIEAGNKLIDDMLLDDYERISNYQSYNAPIVIKHKTCGTLINVKSGCHGLKQNPNKCYKCNKNTRVTLIPGINDIHTQRPDIEKLLKNKSDAYNYSPYTREKISFICPICKNELYKRCIYVTNNGLCCNYCKETISYAERFISNLLKLKNVDFITQYSPDWAGNYKYDFYFKIANKQYIVEVDGGFHYMETSIGRTLNEIKFIDKEKEKIANQHNIDIIRIDYNYSGKKKYEYLKDSVMESFLFVLLDLTEKDLMFAGKKTEESTIEKCLSIWNSLENKNIKILSQKLSISYSATWSLIRRLINMNLISESEEEIKKLNRDYGRKIYGHHSAKKVKCNETGEIFSSIVEASKKYHGNVGSYFKNENRKNAGTLPDGTRLTWSLV